MRCFVQESSTYSEVEEERLETLEAPPRGPPTVQDLCLSLGVSSPTAFRLQQQYRNRTVEELKGSIGQLRAVLQINMEEAGLLASKEPSLLAASPEAVRATFEVLRIALGDVSRMEASRIAVFTPSLLCTPADVLHARFQVLLERLGVSRDQVCSLVFKQPNVLATPIERVEERVADLSTLLAPLQTAQTVGLLCAFPALMVEDMDRMTGKVEKLRVMLDADTAQVSAMVLRYPPLIISTIEVLSSRLHTTSELLSVAPSTVSSLMLSCPGVFTVPSNMLKEQFDKVFALFGQLSRDQVVQLVAENPSLLGIDSLLTVVAR